MSLSPSATLPALTQFGIDAGWRFRCRSISPFQEPPGSFARSAPRYIGANGSRRRQCRQPPSIENDLKSTVCGLLLQSQLALSHGGVPAAVAEKLRTVVDLAGTLRQQLSAPPKPEDASARSAHR